MRPGAAPPASALSAAQRRDDGQDFALHTGHLESGDPAHLGELMGGLARQYPHIDRWGGCCGTWETHLEEIARNVHQRANPSPTSRVATGVLGFTPRSAPIGAVREFRVFAPA